MAAPTFQCTVSEVDCHDIEEPPRPPRQYPFIKNADGDFVPNPNYIEPTAEEREREWEREREIAWQGIFHFILITSAKSCLQNMSHHQICSVKLE